MRVARTPLRPVALVEPIVTTLRGERRIGHDRDHEYRDLRGDPADAPGIAGRRATDVHRVGAHRCLVFSTSRQSRPYVVALALSPPRGGVGPVNSSTNDDAASYAQW